MDFRALVRATSVATVIAAPLALGGCAYPTYRYYSAPCGTPAPAGTSNTPAAQIVPGSNGKQCMYAVPDYAAGPSPYTYAYGYGPYDAVDAGIYDGFGYPIGPAAGAGVGAAAGAATTATRVGGAMAIPAAGAISMAARPDFTVVVASTAAAAVAGT